MDDEELATEWSATALALPSGVTLCGVVYHGPETGWVAFACDATGQTIGPEGLGVDAITALRDLVMAMNRDRPMGIVETGEMPGR